MTAERFGHFAAIDWSGAAGERHKGIAVALCASGASAPELVRPDIRWSRTEVLDWLRHDLPPDTLVGMDLGMSLPFADQGAFLPGWEESPPDARALWAMVEQICARDPHLSASSFVDHLAIARHFRRHGGRQGDLFTTDGKMGGRGRLRLTEHRQQAMGCRPTSNFNLVGASQVGKSSLTGMRLLHRLAGNLPVWPVDPLPRKGSVLIEIYTTIAAMAAGRTASRSKMRSDKEVNEALANLSSQPARIYGIKLDDNKADALVTAAWLRGASQNSKLWRPEGLCPKIATTEGWTFGAT